MTIVHYTNSVSAHQLPLDRELVKLVGAENFRYIYTNESLQGGAQEVSVEEPWIIKKDERVHSTTTTTDYNSSHWLENCDLLIVGGIRPIELMERRRDKGLKTFYQSERWFKPISMGVGSRCRGSLPGWVRMLVPSYRKMARRFVRLMNEDLNFIILPIGPWAKKDFLRLGVRADKMMDWGYFVAPSDKKDKSTLQLQLPTTTKTLRVLWVGRPLWWKRVDTIRKAVAHVPNATLDVFTNIPINQVREEMRKHDVYVLASNAMEGWGAVVNEALEEGMCVIGTHEAGASSALLPPDHLFHCGDVKGLAKLLENWFALSPNAIGEWTAEHGAQRLLDLYKEMR